MPEDREHCSAHEHRDQIIEENTKTAVSLQSSFATLKWVIGGLMTIGIFIMGIGISLLLGQIGGIGIDLKSINVSVHSIALDQVAVKSDIDNIKWRLEQLETMKVARRR